MRRRLAYILQRLDEGGIEASCYATTGKGDATREAARGTECAYDMIIAAGGDGTLNEVINGMVEGEKRLPLGVFPFGTTNDFANALGIQGNWRQYCDFVIRQQAYPVDIGKVNDRYFINVAAGGSLTELTYEVPSRLKTMIGQLAYYIKGIEKMVSLSPQELTIRAHGQEELHGHFMLFLIANTNFIGGSEKLVPGARMDDGKFDVLAIRKCNLAEMIMLATLALRGEHLNDKRVVYFQTDHMGISFPRICPSEFGW